MSSNKINAYTGKMARSFLVIILIMSFVVIIPPKKADAVAPALPVLGAAAVFATCAGLLGYLPIASNQSGWDAAISSAYDDFMDTTRAENAQAAIEFEAFVNNCVATQKIAAQGFLNVSQTLLQYFSDAVVPEISSTLPSSEGAYIDLSEFGFDVPIEMIDYYPAEIISAYNSANNDYTTKIPYIIVQAGHKYAEIPYWQTYYRNVGNTDLPTAVNMTKSDFGVRAKSVSGDLMCEELLPTGSGYNRYIRGTATAGQIKTTTFNNIPLYTTSGSPIDTNKPIRFYLDSSLLYTLSLTFNDQNYLFSYNGLGWTNQEGQAIDPALPTDSDYGRLEALPDEIRDFTQDSSIIGKDVLVGNGSLADTGYVDILNPTNEELNRGLTYPDVLDGTGAIPTTTDGVSGATVANPSLAQTISIPGVGEMTLADAITAGYVTSISYSGDLTMPTNPGQTNFSFIDKFPFCIPFDLIAVLGVMVASPEAPSFTLAYPTDLSGGTQEYILDLEPFYPIAIGLKSLLILLFIVGLASKTRDLIRG